MFAFNPIPKTAAAAMEDQLSTKAKNMRLREVIELQNAITLEINQSQVGEVYEVLVEGLSPKNPKRITGLTRQNKTVNFPGSTDLVGQTVRVRATEGHLYGFVGKLIDTD
jgi:tRNA-2-methylthio-N6-dimethylallyladenosine synthase